MVAHGKISEDKARVFFRQIVSAIAYCHDKKIVHRDLKAENLLLDSDLHIKIIDFGLSNIFSKDKLLTTPCGSPTYAAPELILKNGYQGPEVDVWSMGIVLFVFVTGKLPFTGSDLLTLFKKIISCEYELPDFLSEECKDLISKILVVDRNQRMTVDDILQHKWLQGNDSWQYISYTSNSQRSLDSFDCQILHEMEKLGFNRDHVIEALLNNSFNHLTTTFNLLAKIKSKNNDFQPNMVQAAVSTPASVESSPCSSVHNSPDLPGISVCRQHSLQIATISINDHFPTSEPTARKNSVVSVYSSNSKFSSDCHLKKENGQVEQLPTNTSYRRRLQAEKFRKGNSETFNKINLLTKDDEKVHTGAAGVVDSSPSSLRKRSSSIKIESSPLRNSPPTTNLPMNNTYSSNRSPIIEVNNDIDNYSQSPSSFFLNESSASINHSTGNSSNTTTKTHRRYKSEAYKNATQMDHQPITKPLWSELQFSNPDSNMNSGHNGNIITVHSNLNHSISSSSNSGCKKEEEEQLEPPCLTEEDLKNWKAFEESERQQISDSNKKSFATILNWTKQMLHRRATEKPTNQPREARIAHSNSTTSSKPPKFIISEIKQVLENYKIQYEHTAPFCLKAIYAPKSIRFEVEICTLPNLNKIYVVRLKRIAGGWADYKELCDLVLTNLTL